MRSICRLTPSVLAAFLLSMAVNLVGYSLSAHPSVVGQEPPATSGVPAGTWRVRVKRSSPYFLTVRAKEAPMTQIAAELSRKLKAPVVLSRVMKKQRVTLDFEDLPLETALGMMAPLPYDGKDDPLRVSYSTENKIDSKKPSEDFRKWRTTKLSL